LVELLIACWSALHIAVVLIWTLGFPPMLNWVIPARFRACLSNLGAEIHPFIPYILVIDLAVDVWGETLLEGWPAYLFKAMAFMIWLTERNDDDRWKRRRRKLRARLERAGARLIVVPAGK
jgi:hypothetical protein